MIINGEAGMKNFGESLGRRLIGGEVIELIGDVGAGKTTFTRGLAKGLGVDETLQSPTFTISREYDGQNLRLVHYDFYRLNTPGIMADELAESIADTKSVVAIEWSGIASEILPDERLVISIKPVAGDVDARELELSVSKGLAYVNEGAA